MITLTRRDGKVKMKKMVRQRRNQILLSLWPDLSFVNYYSITPLVIVSLKNRTRELCHFQRKRY